MPHPRGRSKRLASIQPGFVCGFSLFAAWFILLPRLALASSSVAYRQAFTLGAGFLMLLAFVAVLDSMLEKRACPARLALCSAAAAAAGFAFLFFTDAPLRLACLGFEAAAGIALLFLWGRVLCRLAVRELYLCVLGAIAATAALHLFTAAADSALLPSANTQGSSNLTLAALSFAPLASAALGGASMARRGPGEALPSGTEAVKARSTSSRLLAASAGMRAGAPVLILCLTSLVASFASGFAYLPHYLDWSEVALVRSMITLSLALGGALYLLRKPTPSPSHTGYLVLIGPIFAVTGLSTLVLANPLALLASRGMLAAAWDCSFLSAFVLLCGFIQTQRLPFDIALALGIAGTGTCWGYGLGIAVKRLLGYDLETLAGFSAACTFVLAIGLFLLLARDLGTANQKRADVSASGPDKAVKTAVPGDSPFDAGAAPGTPAMQSPGEAGCSGTQQVPCPRPSIDAASARMIIRNASTDVLASYKLSPRELQVSLLVLDGCTAAAASESLGISIATVKFHLGNAYRKLGIQSKAELLAVAKGGGRSEGGEQEREGARR